ncbi:MAG: ArdC-like ssDNA-binding domain-containing protein [Acidimicrobiia bacterium]|nr:ArdC-like ssDNA-binding domain-containing protein [Acidimicrobiia bacterium]
MESAEPTTNRSDAVDHLHEQLQASLQELVTSEDWQKALAVAARFHDYSFSNTQLIWAQSLARGFTPSRVAGYRAWQELGRHVRRGEKGLQILAPVVRKVTPENGEDEERRVVGFRVVHVFDLAQTEGEALPEVPVALVEGDLPSHWEQVSGLITGAGFDLQVADLERLGEANGITDWQQRDVVVRASLPGAQRFKTAVHELAHVRLHEPTSDGRPSCRGIVEVEAESVAYMVCAALGIDSAGYSLPYVASWSGGDVTKVAATANRVIGCARQVLTQLEQERQLEREPARDGSLVEVRDLETARPAQDRQPPRRKDLEEILIAATVFYRKQLQEPTGASAVDFLRSRGIDEEAVERWQLGFGPDSWQSLTTALRRHGFKDDLLVEAGVVRRSRQGRLYDLMRNRVIFPILDQQGNPRGLAGRLVAGDGPKYMNTPETDLYKKSRLLYGLHLAAPAITEQRHAVIVEGYTDAIAAHQVGINHAVATGGTAVTQHHLSTLQGIASTITLAFDGDGAGAQVAERVADMPTVTTDGAHVRIASLPTGSDPASLVEAGKAGVLSTAIADALPLIHHLLERIVSRYSLDEPEAVARALHEAGTLVVRLTDSNDRTDAIAHLARLVQREESLVELALADEVHVGRQMRKRSQYRSLS